MILIDRPINIINSGSRDNISAIVAKLPGAVIGDESLGGVVERRKQREITQQQQQAQIPENTKN